MKKNKKKNVKYLFPTICLIVGALITTASTLYISFNLTPKESKPTKVISNKYTIIDLNYRYNYKIDDNINNNVEILQKSIKEEINTEKYKEIKEEKQLVKKDNKKVEENKEEIKEPIVEKETTKTTINNIVTEEEKPKEEVKTEPNIEYTAVLEKNATEEDFNEVLNKYSMTAEELYTIIAIVGTEGGSHNYTEAYAIINLIYNRTQSKRWSGYVTSLGKDGNTLYGQATAKGQFTVYSKGTYLGSMYNTSIKAYHAVINFLLDLNLMHNYLSLRPASAKVEGTMYTNRGNKYYNELTISDHK